MLSTVTRHVQGKQGIRLSLQGFVKDKSCLTNLISSCDRVTHLMGEGKAVYGVCLDCSKAFHTVSHSIILEKLADHGLDECALCCIEN